jgi:DNA-directed RNA polymerase beta subunit
LKFDQIPQYTRLVKKVFFPIDPNEPFLLVYISENSSLIEDYARLNMRRIDVRHVVVPKTRVPMTILNEPLRKIYKSLGLLSYSTVMVFPKDKNLFYDLTPYLKKVDASYRPTTYRQRAGFLIKDLIFKSFASFPSNYKKVLIYSIDITKPINSFPNRKIFPILRDLKEGNPNFDHMMLVTLDEGSARFRALIKDGEYKFQRIYNLLKKIKIISSEEEKQEEVDAASNEILKKISDTIAPGDKGKVRSAIQNFLSKDQKSLDQISTGRVSGSDKDRVAVASVLYSTSGDLSKAKRLANAVSDKKLSTAVKAVNKQYADNLLETTKAVSLTDSIFLQQADIPKQLDYMTPEHLFQKRKIDFETNLRNDMINAFKVLEGQDLPMQFQSLTIEDKPPRAGEIEKSDIARIVAIIIGKDGKKHKVRFNIPKIDPDTGTFRVNGRKKCLINQLVLNPISFPGEYEAKFESSYSVFRVYSKKMQSQPFLQIYMGTFRIPLLVFLSFAFGFDHTLENYGIKYDIVEKRPAKDEIFTKVPSSYLVFKNVNTDLKQELVNSFLRARVSDFKIDHTFASKKYFTELILQITGRINSTYHINLNIKNIVDPVSKQVLINKQLPNDLENIIKYMASKATDGYKEDRNDLTVQRTRNSEILVHLAQKQILAAYTEYKEQYLSGNKDAKLTIPETNVISQFNRLEIVQDMEYANPLEEMATITKVSPVGKSVGGIPDKEAVQLDAGNVHDSYFGNIDPLDTAEGANIGITQQLAIDAFITSARGLFGQKEIKDTEYGGILSTNAAMIPFVGNNDGNRILMAVNQAKQMIPLLNPEPPAVQSGFESVLTNVLSDSFIKRSPCKGKIGKISLDNIDVICEGNKKQKVDISPVHLKSGSGKNTLSTFNPIVKTGQSVKQRQIIAEGSGISEGTISLGRNVLVAYTHYKGYNFEDGIVISDRLAKNKKLVSLHGIEEEIIIDEKDKVLQIIDIGTDTKKGDVLLKKTIGDIDELLGFTDEQADDEDTQDGRLIKKSPGGVVVGIEVFSNVDPNTFPILKSLIAKTAKKYKKPDDQKFTKRGLPIKGVLIRFKIEQQLQTVVGDKLCNRHGHKGIIALVEKEELMPRTPWGEPVDLIFNPLGIIGRMNMGQMFEVYCGLISKGLAEIITKVNSKSEGIKAINVTMTALDSSNNKEYSKKLIKNLTNLSTKKYNDMVSQIKNSGYIPIIVPPFKSPSHKHIMAALKTVNKEPAYHLLLPEYNVKTKHAVPVGYMYITKLEHIGEAKMHSRSTGPTVGKTLQPTGGKRREGGQRMGEGDTWSMLSYNCPLALSEFFGPLSDDIISKNEIITDIIQTGDASYRMTKASPTKDLLNAYFVAMMLEEK